jgi:hypothetical protein
MDRIKLTCARTLIGEQTKPYDFEARHGDEAVGRIFRFNAGPRAGNWQWTMIAFGPHLRPPVDCHGTVATKAEAAALVAECYAYALAAATTRNRCYLMAIPPTNTSIG